MKGFVYVALGGFEDDADPAGRLERGMRRAAGRAPPAAPRGSGNRIGIMGARSTLRTLVLALAVLSLPLAAGAGLAAKFELFVDDVAASTRFYETLGFRVVHLKAADGYTTLELDGVVVALSPLPGWLPMRFLAFLRLPPLGTEIVFYPESLERTREQLRAAGYHPGEIRRQPWGDRDFRLQDPSGYYVRVSEGGPIPGGP